MKINRNNSQQEQTQKLQTPKLQKNHSYYAQAGEDQI